MQDIFTDIYKNNTWGNKESVSGAGSTIERTSVFIEELIELINKYNIKTVLDVPCGDFNWMKEVVKKVSIKYVGIDIVKEIIQENKKYENENISFLHKDMSKDDLPTSDLIICRDALVHLCFYDALKSICKFKDSGSKYLLTTTFLDLQKNENIMTGDWRRLNLQIFPFEFPSPEFIIDEKCYHSGGIYSDKLLALWDLKKINIT